jgi:hypothetical protein
MVLIMLEMNYCWIFLERYGKQDVKVLIGGNMAPNRAKSIFHSDIFRFDFGSYKTIA